MPFERAVLDAVRKGGYERAALVTLVSLEGSGYQRPGARMVVFENGTSVGSVTGGCLEKTVIEKALAAIAAMKELTFTVDTMSDGDAVFGYGLGCAGTMTLTVEPFAAGSLPSALAAAFRAEETRQPQIAGFETLLPLPRLIVIGAGNDSRPIADIARASGFEVIHVRRIDDVAVKLDSRTAAILVTHNVLADLEAARTLASPEIAYVGVVGSRARFAWLRGELEREGLPVAKFKGPAGLDIGAKTPSEIAVSIVAEATKAMIIDGVEDRRRGAGGPTEVVRVDKCSTS